MESRFEGFLMKQPGKTTLRTKEGVSAVTEAIEFLRKVKPVRQLNWHNELFTAARIHV